MINKKTILQPYDTAVSFPAVLRFFPSIKLSDIMVFVAIRSLSTQAGCCVSNEYLANEASCSTRAVSSAIKKLASLKALLPPSCPDRKGKRILQINPDFEKDNKDFFDNKVEEILTRRSVID